MTGKPHLSKKLCKVCNHNKLPAINRDVVLGDSMRVVADRYGLLKDNIHRHAQKHIDEAMKRQILVQRKREDDQAVANELNSERVEISSGLRRCVKEVEAILQRAKEREDDPLALASLKEMRATLIDLAKIHGSLKNELVVKVDLTSSPQWSQLREILIEVFADHPEAERAFVSKVRHLGVIEPGARRLVG